MYSRDQIEETLKYDPIATAEKIAGKEAVGLSLLLHIRKSQAIDRMLSVNGDTTFSMDTDQYLEIVEKIGFVQILHDTFIGKSSYDDHTSEEHCYLYYRKPGQLLWCDTHLGKSRNAANVYYCWKPACDNAYRYTSSGSLTEDGIWYGHHDAREALTHKLAGLESNGSFIEPWPKTPFLWFCNWMDTKVENYSYEAITNGRISRLPSEIRTALGI